jgi:hypothetical protein
LAALTQNEDHKQKYNFGEKYDQQDESEFPNQTRGVKECHVQE